MSLVITFLGAHVVPADREADAYTDEVLDMLDQVVEQGMAAFHDITCERGLFTPAQAARLFERSRELAIPTKAHADAWATSEGWRTAVAGGSVSAEHLTYTPDEEIHDVGATDTIAVLLPQAELCYMTDRRANARLLIEHGVPVAIATDYCSSIHATSLATTIGIAAPWFRMTPAETIVGATLNAAYALRLKPTADRSIRQARRPHRARRPPPRGAVPRRRPERRLGRDHRRRAVRHSNRRTPRHDRMRSR